MRKVITAFLVTTPIAFTALSASSRAQAPSSLPSPKPPAAALPGQARNPLPSVAPIASRTAAERPAAASNASYWKPAPPKPKPSALRRFFGRFTSPRDTAESQEGVKVFRDPTTGRTNTINSKPWIEARP